MSTRVLHGEGEPRIILTGSTIHTDTVASASGLSIILTTGGFSSSVLYKQCASKNQFDEDTWGRVVDYDIGTKEIIVDDWSNLAPAAAKAVTIKNQVIDLPYCQNNLIETFELDVLPKRTLYSTGKKIIPLRGFYYFVTLDYSRYAEKDLLIDMQDVYDSSKTASFTFYPRKDNYDVYYTCMLDIEKEISIAQNQRHQGHKNLTFNFEGTQRITKPDLTHYLIHYLLNEDYSDYIYNEDEVTRFEWE